MGDKQSSKMFGAISKWLVFAVLLSFVCVGIYFDQLVAPAQDTEKIAKIFDLLNKPTDDGKGLPKDMVQDSIGFAPIETREVEGSYADLGTEPGAFLQGGAGRKVNFLVETYCFERPIPFASEQFVEIVYFRGAMFSVVVNDRFVPSDKRFRSSLAGSIDNDNHNHNHTH